MTQQVGIFHRKVTLEAPRELSLPSLRSAITEEDLSRFNVPADHFSNFLQEVQTAGIVRTAIILHEEDIMKEATEWREIAFEKDVGHPIILAQELEQFEKKEDLLDLNKYTETTEHPWSLQYYYQLVKKRGFYTKGTGAQIGGVTVKFYNHFSNDTTGYALKEDFEYAYNCIDLCSPNDTLEEVEIRRKNFKENFLNNFELGASFLHIEY